MKNIILALVVLFSLIPQVYAESEVESLYEIPFNWRDETGKEFKLTSLKGSPVVMTLAYTKCKTACPMTMQRVKSIAEKLEGSGKKAHFVIISLDPLNDTPETLAQFKKHYKLEEGSWHLLNGKDQDVRKLSVLLGYSYQKQPQPIGSTVVPKDEIIHSNKIIVLNKEGKISAELEGLGSEVVPFVKKISELD